LWNVKPRHCVERSQCYRDTRASTLICPLVCPEYRQQVPSKRWYLSTNLNGVTSQKNILNITAMRTTNVTSVLRAKRSGKAVHWCVINVHGGSGGIIQLFINFNTIWRSVISFVPRAANTLFCTGRRFNSTRQESHESKELKCVK
jgi:hypothetical protein